MSYELWAMSIAHGSLLAAHSKKKKYEKDITSHISIIVLNDDICAGLDRREIRLSRIA